MGGRLARRRARRAGACALVVALAGCGSSGSSANGIAAMSPAEILATARSAAVGAATVHVAGSILSQGKPISLNMELVADKGGVGRITLGELSIRLVELDGWLYVNGNRSFYERFTAPLSARRLQGTWLKGSAAGQALRSFSSLTDLSKLLGGTLASHGSLTRVAGVSVDGRRTVGVSDLARGGTVYVATSGIPYPLEIVWHGRRRGRVVFDKWNRAAEPTAPTHAINIKRLQSKG